VKRIFKQICFGFSLGFILSVFLFSSKQGKVQTVESKYLKESTTRTSEHPQSQSADRHPSSTPEKIEIFKSQKTEQRTPEQIRADFLETLPLEIRLDLNLSLIEGHSSLEKIMHYELSFRGLTVYKTALRLFLDPSSNKILHSIIPDLSNYTVDEPTDSKQVNTPEGLCRETFYPEEKTRNLVRSFYCIIYKDSEQTVPLEIQIIAQSTGQILSTEKVSTHLN
jgi:hypothetical protein